MMAEKVVIHLTIDEIILGKESYGRLVIPPDVWYGFQSYTTTTSLIINTPDISHDPDEVKRLSLDQDQIPYKWEGYESICHYKLL